MRKIWIVLCVALVVLALVGCGRKGAMNVNELLDGGAKYQGQTVTVQGKVTFTISGVLTMIKMEDTEHPDSAKTVAANISGATLDQLGIQDGDTVIASGKYDSENTALDCSGTDVKKIK